MNRIAYFSVISIKLIRKLGVASPLTSGQYLGQIETLIKAYRAEAGPTMTMSGFVWLL